MQTITHMFAGMPRALLFALLLLLVVFVLRKALGGPVMDPSTGRPLGKPGRRKVCSGCATAHPGFAKYCRRCGKQLS